MSQTSQDSSTPAANSPTAGSLLAHPAWHWIGIPVAAVFLYLLFLAQPSFESQASLIVRESRSDAVSPGLIAGLLNPAAHGSREDALILADFLAGAEFIQRADAKLDLRSHYSAPKFDFVRRLSSKAPSDDFHAYIRKHIRVVVAPDSGITRITVRAFEPAFARELAKFAVAESERAINELNTRLTEARTQNAERDLIAAGELLAAARRDLLAFQIENQVADPANEFGGRLATLAGLDARLVELRADLATKSAYLQENAFELRSLRQQITAIESRREAETSGLIRDGDRSKAATAAAYIELQARAEFALQARTTAAALNEQAKLQAAKQEKFLLPISPPALPEDSVFPRLFWHTLTALALFTCLYAIGRLGLAVIRDHQI